MKTNHWSSLRAESDARLVLPGRQSFGGVITISRLASFFAVLFLGMASSRIASAEEKSNTGMAALISKENSVDSSRPPAEWRPATVGQELIVHDRLRTGEDSRAAVQFGLHCLLVGLVPADMVCLVSSRRRPDAVRSGLGRRFAVSA